MILITIRDTDVGKAREILAPLIAEGRIQDALRLINQYPADMRAALKPFVSHWTGAKTVVGTAQATMEMLRTITLGHDALIAGQIRVDGGVYGLHGVVGLPLVIGNKGVEEIVELALDEAERNLLIASAQSIEEKIAPWVRNVDDALDDARVFMA